MKHKVFVYGTLKEGYNNWKNYLQGKATKITTAKTIEPFWLVNCGYPYMIRRHHVGNPRPVLGEIWEVDDAVLEALDGLEGVEWGHYQRERLDVEGDDGETYEVNAYTHDGNCHNLQLCAVYNDGYIWST